MTKIINRLFLFRGLIFGLFVFFNCSNQNNNSTEITSTEETETVIPDYAFFGIKSGIVEMESSVIGTKQNITMYFDDWGRIVCNDMKMSLLNNSVHIRSIIKDGYVYEIDFNRKTIKKTQINPDEHINYLKIDEEFLKNHPDIKFVGNVELLNKKCKEYLMNIKGIESKVAIWKGIPLRTESKTMGLKITISAKSILENVKISEDVFKIPENFEMI